MTFSLAKNGVCCFGHANLITAHTLYAGPTRSRTCCSYWIRSNRWLHSFPGLSIQFLAISCHSDTMLQRDLPIHTKRKLHTISGTRGMWSIPVRQPSRSNGSSYERAVDDHEYDTVVISSDATPSPGLSRIAVVNNVSRSRADLTITMRIPGTTVGAAPFFQRTAILHVMTNSIRVLEPGLPSLSYCIGNSADIFSRWNSTSNNSRR